MSFHPAGFKPSLRTHSTPIAAGYLQQSVEQWVETCISDVHSGVGKLLNYVTSIKALTAIRDDLWDLLAAVSFKCLVHTPFVDEILRQ